MTEAYVIPISCKTVHKIVNAVILGIEGIVMAVIGCGIGITTFIAVNPSPVWAPEIVFRMSMVSLCSLLWILVCFLIQIWCDIEFTCIKEGSK